MSRAKLLTMFRAELHRNAQWRRGFYGVLLAGVAMLALILFVEVPKMKEQRRHAAEIRRLGENGLAAFEIHAGGHLSGVVRCTTVTDGATLDFLSGAFATATTSIALDRTTASYEFTAVAVDRAGDRVNLIGEVADFSHAFGKRYANDVFLRFSYTGPVAGFRSKTWGYPVRIPGMAPWVVRTFAENDCPREGMSAPGCLVEPDAGCAIR